MVECLKGLQKDRLGPHPTNPNRRKERKKERKQREEEEEEEDERNGMCRGWESNDGPEGSVFML